MQRFATFFLCFFSWAAAAQLIYTDPVFPTANDAVTVYFDASEGNAGLADCACNVYVHTGVITNLSTGPSDWKYVQTSWGVANAAWLMTPVVGQPNVFSYTISPSATSFYSVPGGETVEQLAFVFRNADGSKVGKDVGDSDIYTPIYSASAGYLSALLTPTQPSLLLQIGSNTAVKGAANQPSTLRLFDNGSLLTETTGTVLNYTLTPTVGGTHVISFEATETSSGEVQTHDFTYVIPLATVVENPPAGTQLGATYLSDTEVILSLYAPNKDYVFVVGDNSNWQPNTAYQMKKSTDGNRWWIQIGGLTSGEPFRYQYMVSGGLVVADPLSEVILSPWDDPYIPAVTYPNLPDYPVGQTNGNVSLLRPGYPVYVWNDADFVRPEKTDLVIYELLLRDFIARHDYKTLIDTLDYLQNLGVNAIELMPVNEFEGNESWGYNISFHMAIDKYYGTTDDFKSFVDACHQRGIAVIADVVFNHAFGQSPLAQLYFDGANNRPAADNPWLNPIPKHPYNVGYDFNHESAATKEYVKRCNSFMLDEYHIDGFRYDLSKGFTQTNTLQNEGQFGVYDPSRVAILKDYADNDWATEPGAYVILEHFADNTEEKILADYGMMLWTNANGAFRNAVAGKASNNFGHISYKSKNWNDPHAVGYQESHDEERMMYECLKYGTTNNGYFIRDTSTALSRLEAANIMFYSVPGPKMLWQFGELGYAYCIDYCISSATCNNCRVGNKPIRWDYFQRPDRHRLYDVTRSMIQLKTNYDVFRTTDFTASLSGNGKAVRLNTDTLDCVAIANFDDAAAGVNPVFTHTGWWYEFFSGDSLNVAVATDYIQLLPGEYRLYFDRQMPEPVGGYVNYVVGNEDVTRTNTIAFALAPNPTTNGQSTLRYQLQKAGNVQCDMFDALGRRVSTLVSERQNQGSYEVSTPKLPAGQYIIRLSLDGDTASRQLIVIE